MRKRLFSLLAAVLTAATLLSGCQAANELENPEAPFPAQVQNVVISQAPASVISLSPSLTDVLRELGYEGNLIGRVDEYDQPAEIGALPSVGSSAEPDIQKIVELSPDLLLSQNSFSKKDLETLTAANVQVLCIPAATNFEELKAIYTDLSTVFVGKVDGAAKGEAVYATVQQALDQITAKLPAEKKSFLYALDADGLVATPDTFESAALSLLGVNVATGEDYAADLAAAAQSNLDVFLVAEPYVQEHVAQSESFKDFEAVKNGQVISIDPELLQVQSLGIADGLRKIAALLYPDAGFEDTSSQSSVSSEAQSTPADTESGESLSSGTESVSSQE